MDIPSYPIILYPNLANVGAGVHARAAQLECKPHLHKEARKRGLMSNSNGNSTSLRLKTGLAEMLKGGVIMDVTNVEQAVIAEKAGAVAVMALERVPAQIRAEGGVARMASPKKI